MDEPDAEPATNSTAQRPRSSISNPAIVAQSEESKLAAIQTELQELRRSVTRSSSSTLAILTAIQTELSSLKTSLQQPRQIADLTHAERCVARFENLSGEGLWLRSYCRSATNLGGEGLFQRVFVEPNKTARVEALDGWTQRCTSFHVEIRNDRNWLLRSSFRQWNVLDGGRYLLGKDWSRRGGEAVSSL